MAVKLQQREKLRDPWIFFPHKCMVLLGNGTRCGTELILIYLGPTRRACVTRFRENSHENRKFLIIFSNWINFQPYLIITNNEILYNYQIWNIYWCKKVNHAKSLMCKNRETACIAEIKNWDTRREIRCRESRLSPICDVENIKFAKERRDNLSLPCSRVRPGDVNRGTSK